METGTDLLDRWVARMIMLGIYRTDTVPFKDVYLHGMVNDEHNQKMSKSKGNVINPMEKIAQYGSDALRLGIIANRSAAQNQAFSEGSLIAGRNFCNKLWNVARFIEDKLGDNYQPKAPVPQSLVDHWIVNELTRAAEAIDAQLADYRFAEAAETVYQTLWNSVADWYIEASKAQQNDDMLSWVLTTVLKLTHPFAPFVTETIWQTLPWCDNLLIKQAWPTPIEYDEISSSQFIRLKELVAEIRFVMSELPGNDKYPLLYGSDALIEDNQALIKQLTRVKSIEHTEQPRGLRLANTGREAWLDIDAKTLYDHAANLEIRLAQAHAQYKNLEARLGNEHYVSKAPAHLVEETRKELQTINDRIERLRQELDVLNT